MRVRKPWTHAEVEKLRCLAGKYSLDHIAQTLGHPPAAIEKKACDLKISLAFHRRRRQPATVDPGPAGMDLTG